MKPVYANGRMYRSEEARDVCDKIWDIIVSQPFVSPLEVAADLFARTTYILMTKIGEYWKN
jgi:hypothetical protein